MKCTFCGYADSKVVDSRAADDNSSIRRRRECLKCGRRFTTYEILENTPLLVVKSDGRKETFNPSKIKAGIIKACEKRGIPTEKIDALALEIERKAHNELKTEISAQEVGELVMAGLKELDEVAYIRFASVYRRFTDVSTFTDFIREFEKKLK